MAELIRHPRCPYCHDGVDPDDTKTACDGCMSWHHAPCWREHGACAACGGARALTTAEEVASEPAPPSADLEAAPAAPPSADLEAALARILPPARALAAALGEPAARRYLAPGEPDPANAAQDLQTWIEGLARWGAEVLTRVAIAAVRRVAPLWEVERPADSTVGDVLAAAEAYLACPCAPHKQQARDAGLRADAAGDTAATLGAARAAHAAARLARLPGLEPTRQGPRAWSRAVETAASALAAARGATQPNLADREAIRAAACEAVIEWLIR